MEILQNDFLTVSVNPRGAELSSIRHRVTGLEYLWQADPAVWGKHSPVLFPIVGTLRENRYAYQGKYYPLDRHGFARERNFSPELRSREELVFLLRSDENTRQVYPFDFDFRIRYALTDSRLSVTYLVSNPSPDPLFFSVGGHPAFRVPLAEGTAYNDYFLEFNKAEDAGRWPINAEGLIEAASVPFLTGSRLPLEKSLFNKDALVFKDLRSDSVRLGSANTPHGWQFDFGGFPYLGIWAARGGDFVCVEPWCGIADSVGSDQDFTCKEGIHHLRQGEVFSRQWSVHFY